MNGANASVFVVVAAYNEGRVIRSTLEPLIGAGYSVVVVDDGSRDDTSSVLAQLPVYSLRHLINLGQGAALQTGMAFALRQEAEYVVHFDADGQHRMADIPVLLEPLVKGEADVVLGSRFLKREHREAVPEKRRLVLRVARFINLLFTGVWLTDAHNGFRALTRAAAARIALRENGYAHASEILSQIARQKLRYVERPTAIAYTDYSRAKGQPLSNAFNIVLDLVLRGLFR